MRTDRGGRLAARLGTAALGIALSLAAGSCAQDVKITAPRYALVYGVAAYPSAGLVLQYTVKDSDAIASLLSGQGWIVSESTDAQVTKAKIQSDIVATASVSPDATVLVYFSGHGTSIPPNTIEFPGYAGAYIVPYNAINAAYSTLDPDYAQYLISPAEMGAWLSQSGTKNAIVLLDCCNSGGFAPSGSAIDASPPDYFSQPAYSAFAASIANFGSLLSANASASGQKSPIVLAAAGSAESSYDGTTDMQHGVFTYFLLQAASAGDSNGDGVVTTTEAYAYTAAAIKAQWDSVYYYDAFLPHLSGGTRDLVLFTR